MKDLWQGHILTQLQTQMTRATYDTWVANTQQVGELTDGQLTIAVPNGFAKDWLENRLLTMIERTAQSIVGQPVFCSFVIEANGSEGNDHLQENGHTPDLDPGPGQIAVELISFDPTQRGFVMASNYAVRFWQPYLNLFTCPLSPFTLWVTVKSFAYECQRETWPSIGTLADMCAGGQRYKILGRAERKGCKRIVGALEILEAQRIIYVRRKGDGRKVSYRFRVLENLPLLTPHQMEQLTPLLQRSHKRFLEQCEIDYEEWEQMTLPSITEET